jgi:cytochrome c peroxidase
VGAEGRTGRRNAMPLFNLAWKPSFFWDGRAPSLRDQVLHPIRDPDEMNESPERVIEKLRAVPGYADAFAAVFGDAGMREETLAMALEQFLFTRISGDAKVDRVLAGQVELTASEARGFVLFFSESDPGRGMRGADCFHCHGGAHFTNHQFANNGLDADEARTDLGRFNVTGNAWDRGRFIVPSLRNVALTAPYMHDGRFATIEEVIAHYNSGLKSSATLDPNLARHRAQGGLGLSESDQADLAAFLRSLTGTAAAGGGR